MAESLISRFTHAWNVFFNKDPTPAYTVDYGSSYSYRPDRIRLSNGVDRSIITAIYNRIALDVSANQIEHIRTNEEGRFLNIINSPLNKCLSLEANIDQTGRAFIKDVVLSMFDEGCVAVVPTVTSVDPKKSSGFDIYEMRTGKIVNWYPKHVKIQLYNEDVGQKQEIVLPKKMVAIIENPFYEVMNERSSILQRLIRKMNLLDAIDEQSGSGKLDLIIQLPYVIKTEARRQQAETRRKEIETQLAGSKYGIAYTDGTEHITQLNRAVENNMMKQIEYLTSMLYSQLGLTQEIMNGTADEKAMTNYMSRTVEPIIAAIVDEMKRKFLTKTAISQNQTIKFYNDPFKLVPVSQIAEMADKMTRNEIMTSNEFRQAIGMRPSKEPSADELRNKNLSQPADAYKKSNMQNEEGPSSNDDFMNTNVKDL